MENRTVQMTLRRLEASDGHMLTSDGRYFCRTVYLGVGDDGSAYREVTEEEADAALAAIAAEREAERAAAGAQERDGDAGDAETPAGAGE